ncbi:efflux RND transporter periplasmic adaptor subunit [Pseudohaliea sp.]|uniref:HlyD family secretion protein n=1 Tax=Pseudohaliea sp. TaxID=2740289 RepID=UPI0032EFD880
MLARKLEVERGREVPVEPDGLVLREGEPARETLPHRRRWRPGAGSLVALVLLAAALVPAFLWLQHQAGFVTSRNAMVRAHLSEPGARIAGLVTAVHVDAGDTVQKGDTLVELEDRHLRAEVARARSEHAALEARLEVERTAIELDRERLRMQVAGAEAELRRVTAALAAAESRAEDANAFHDTRQSLLPGRAISKEAVRDAAAKARTAAALARAAVAEQEAAENALAEARHAQRELELREKQLHVLAAQRDTAAAELARAEADLEATVIRAPADGAIIRRLVQPGMAMDVGTPALSMWFSDRSWVEAWIGEADLADIAPGSAVRVSSPALRGQAVTGVVATVGLATDFEMPLDYLPKPRGERLQQAPLVGVAIVLDELPDVLRPGISMVVDIERVKP